MALAVEIDADNTETLALIDQYFYRKHIPNDKLDIDPDMLFDTDEQTQLHAATPSMDMHVKCVITALVRKDDKYFDRYNTGESKEYVMESIPTVSLWSIKYLMPMVSYNMLGYYEVSDIKFNPKTKGLRFKLGQFFPLGDVPVNVAGKMRHGELINLEYVFKLYN